MGYFKDNIGFDSTVARDIFSIYERRNNYYIVEFTFRGDNWVLTDDFIVSLMRNVGVGLTKYKRRLFITDVSADDINKRITLYESLDKRQLKNFKIRGLRYQVNFKGGIPHSVDFEVFCAILEVFNDR